MSDKWRRRVGCLLCSPFILCVAGGYALLWAVEWQAALGLTVGAVIVAGFIAGAMMLTD